MKTKKIVTAVAFACATGLSSASALALGPNDWAGGYIGGSIGYGVDTGVKLDYGFGSTSSSFDMKGYLIGVQGGFNWAAGPVVVGIEGDANYADIKGDAPCPNPTWSCEAKMDQLFALRARVGFPINNFLLYGAVGVASGNIEVQTVSPGGVEWPDSARQTGFTAGLGGEMAFNQHLRGRLDLSYTDLGDNDYTVDFGQIVSVETRVRAVRLGVNYRF